jgi:vacuolar-type H+-ATPase subunit I/STV1
MESQKVPNEDKEMECFTKLQSKLDKVKQYRNHNQERLEILKNEMRKVRDHMEDVNRQQNLAIHKNMTSKNKPKP